MLYGDTSVLVTLLTNEPKTADVTKWYVHCNQELASSHWCMTEFASALCLKQRSGQLSVEQAEASWDKFERLCQHDLKLLPDAALDYYHGALFAKDAKKAVRAGDALHLACALSNKASAMVSLDLALLNSTKMIKLKPIAI
jgi:predicted nucleic acid-binding protein